MSTGNQEGERAATIRQPRLCLRHCLLRLIAADILTTLRTSYEDVYCIGWATRCSLLASRVLRVDCNARPTCAKLLSRKSTCAWTERTCGSRLSQIAKLAGFSRFKTVISNLDFFPNEPLTTRQNTPFTRSKPPPTSLLTYVSSGRHHPAR